MSAKKDGLNWVAWVLVSLIGALTAAGIVGIYLEAPNYFYYYLSGILTAVSGVLVRIVLKS